MEFSTLKSQDVRDYWDHEENDFTPWLAEQIRSDEVSELEDVLGLDLVVSEVEKSVGRYSLDILAESEDGDRRVVIENQLEASDHDHLGKSLAYASGVDADLVVWIASRFHDEHRDAMQWLNGNTTEDVDLFAVRLDVFQIGDSDPALRFDPVAEPSEWKRKARRPDRELSELRRLQEEFWTQFRDRIDARDTPLSARKPRPRNWYRNPIGRSDLNLSFVVNSNDDELRAGLTIPDGKETYRKLERSREEIERETDHELNWSGVNETRSGKMRGKVYFSRDGDIRRRDNWDEYLGWMLDRGEACHDLFYERVQRL